MIILVEDDGMNYSFISIRNTVNDSLYSHSSRFNPLLLTALCWLLYQARARPKINQHPMEDAMSGYESLAWIKDKHGKEYVCPISVLKGDTRNREELSDEERQQCMDVNQIIGTERW